MTSDTQDNAVQLTLKDFASLQPRRLTIEMDDMLLRQLRRVLPARLAGHCEWMGPLDAPAWLRWHWYYDESAGDFIVNAEGIESNIVLINAAGAPLPPGVFMRFALRAIRRRRDWRPDIPAQGRRAPLARPAPPAPIVVKSTARGGHAEDEGRAYLMLGELARLDDTKQFTRIAKLARDRFGFTNVLAIARDPRNPGTFVMENNFLGSWQEIYQREHLILIDPRLHGDPGPTAWSARDLQPSNPAFWAVAMEHGIGSGWLMRSADGQAALVLSRPELEISPQEIAAIEPGLRVLASLAHALMKRMLSNPAMLTTLNGERALPDNDLEIIGHMQHGKYRKEIASIMDLSMSTLDRRLQFIRKKLGVERSAQIVDAATRIGLIPWIQGQATAL